MIKTRQSLVEALHEAAELEHGLLLQYLFAALSLKQPTDEGITPVQENLVQAWRRTILIIARQEMAHLGTVCNLLSAIGATPRFAGPNFPQRAKTYYPLEFRLSRFSDESVYRFIRAELPQGEKPRPGPYQLPREGHPLRREDEARVALILTAALEPELVPEPVEYDYVGQLYREILEGFLTIDERVLFIGPSFAQDIDKWSRGLSIIQVKNRKTAQDAIDFIVQEGEEGSPGHRAGSHYELFLEIRKQLNDAMKADQAFDPARPVGENPRTREHRDAPVAGGTVVTMIEEPAAKAIAELFNAAYLCSVAWLQQYYSFGGETLRQRSALQQAARELMSTVIRPLAEELTMMSVADGSVSTAGPSFEFYCDYQLPVQLPPRWSILLEMLKAVSDGATYITDSILKTGSFSQQRVQRITKDVKMIQDAIASTLGDEFVVGG